MISLSKLVDFPSTGENPMAIGVVVLTPVLSRRFVGGIFRRDSSWSTCGRFSQYGSSGNRRGDVILKVNEIEITDREQLIDTVRATYPGKDYFAGSPRRGEIVD